jgi:hypothetical protein
MGWYNAWDIGLGAVLIVLLLEATRRTLGWVMTGLACFLAYVFAGPWLPGLLAHKGYSLERTVAQLYLTTEGIFGVPLGVAATYVFIFILFGVMLEATGAGRFFIDLAYALAGRRRGGPAKAAVVASGFMASFSGSAIANAATTGAFTIPLMKRLGYTPEESAGVEASASTGGQIMPPIMGAGAFLMAEYTGVPYLDIVTMALVPALLYFLTVYLFVDAIAAKRGMRGQPRAELPSIPAVLRTGGHFLLPLAVLIFYLVQGVSPTRVGFVAVLAVFLVSLLRASSRLSPRAWIDTLVRAAHAALPVTIACATAGIVVGAVGLTGHRAQVQRPGGVPVRRAYPRGAAAGGPGEPGARHGAAGDGGLHRAGGAGGAGVAGPGHRADHRAPGGVLAEPGLQRHAAGGAGGLRRIGHRRASPDARRTAGLEVRQGVVPDPAADGLCPRHPAGRAAGVIAFDILIALAAVAGLVPAEGLEGCCSRRASWRCSGRTSSRPWWNFRRGRGGAGAVVG